MAKERRTEQIGLRLTPALKALVQQEAANRRWYMAQVVICALEERYGLAEPSTEPASDQGAA